MRLKGGLEDFPTIQEGGGSEGEDIQCKSVNPTYHYAEKQYKVRLQVVLKHSNLK